MDVAKQFATLDINKNQYTVSVPYPQLSCYNPEIFRAAAMGAYAGDAAFNGVGYNSGCGCGC